MLIPSPNGLTGHEDSQISHPGQEDMYTHYAFPSLSISNGHSI